MDEQIKNNIKDLQSLINKVRTISLIEGCNETKISYLNIYC